jgi:hypothetical protein
MQGIALDKALEEELKKPIETLGRQLTAVSAKFVPGLHPLTQHLQQRLRTVRV